MIEVILGVNIILSMFIIVALLIGSNKASHIKRIKIEEGNRIIYCVMQEIKYNMTINELIGKENLISFSLKYKEIWSALTLSFRYKKSKTNFYKKNQKSIDNYIF